MIDDASRARVQTLKVARLATIGTDGSPHLVPITFALEGETLWTAVDHKPKRTTALQRLANIDRDPRITVLFDHYDEDWTKLWWCRATGRADVLHDGPEHTRGVQALMERYEQYREHVPDGAVIRVSIEAWRTWSAS